MANNHMISVIGSGTMGNGIAHVFALCDQIQKVNLIDLDVTILEKAKLLVLQEKESAASDG